MNTFLRDKQMYKMNIVLANIACIFELLDF